MSKKPRVIFLIGNLRGRYGYTKNVYGMIMGGWAIKLGKPLTGLAAWIVDKLYEAKS